MENSEVHIITGSIALDKNGERLFLSTDQNTHVRFGEFEVKGNRVLRILNFESDFSDKSVNVSIAARLATPEELSVHSELTNPTLTAEKIVTFDAIQKQAYEIFESGKGGFAEDNWLRAERELLNI